MDSKPLRDANGRLLPGQSANPTGRNGGRPAYPAWFKDKGEDALRYLLDVATGVVDVGPELRFKAATIVVDRIYGKAPETVSVDGEFAVSRIIRTIVDPATASYRPADGND